MKMIEAIQILDTSLHKKGLKRELIICGGAALNLQNISSRETKDIDVLVPLIDEQLKKISLEIAAHKDLAENWLNNGPRRLIDDMGKGWEDKIVEVFKGKALTLYSIGREDMIFSKLYAMCDRGQDRTDLLAMKVTKAEIKEIGKKVKLMDENPQWPSYVEDCLNELISEIDYE